AVVLGSARGCAPGLRSQATRKNKRSGPQKMAKKRIDRFGHEATLALPGRLDAGPQYGRGVIENLFSGISAIEAETVGKGNVFLCISLSAGGPPKELAQVSGQAVPPRACSSRAFSRGP